MLAYHLKIILPGLAALFISAAAQAALVSTTYTNTNDEPATSYPDAAYMNPTGPMTFFVSAGLDRKVRIELRRASGELIDSATSSLIGADDKITVDGESFYGAQLTLASPGEGDYVTVAKILDNKENPLQTEEHSWTLDRSGYQFDGTPRQSQYMRYGAGKGNWELVTKRGLKLIAPINGSGAPAESAVLTTTAQKTGKKRTYTNFNVTSTKINSGLPRGSSLWPDREGRYSVDMAVTDAAGNITHTQWQTRFDAKKDPFELIGITYNGNDRPHPWSNIDGLDEFTPYEPGMTIDNKNPRVLLRANTEEMYPDSIFGIYSHAYCGVSDNEFCVRRDIKYRADGKVYFASKRATMKSYKVSQYSAKGADMADNTFHRSVEIAAKRGLPIRSQFTITSIKFVDGDVVQGHRAKRNASQDERIDEVRIKLDEAVPYALEVTGDFGHKTTIPAGQTRATLKTVHRYTRWFFIKVCAKSTHDTCQSENAAIHRDNAAPRLEDWTYEDEAKGQYRVQIREKYATTSNAWGVRKASLIATNDSGGEQLIDPNFVKNDRGHYTFVFSVDSLSSGHYDFSVRATDKFGNKGAWALESRDYDGNAPSVAIKAYDKPLGDKPVKTLGDLSLVIADDNAQAKPYSVKLIGGPTDRSISLAWTKQEDGLYALEYPVMFPSVADGDYRIVAKAIDPTGNIGQASYSFTYEPLRISMADDNQDALVIPAASHAFKRGDGGDLIRTEPFKLYDGSKLKGTYDVYATVRSDATVALMINGVRVNPGQTLSVVGDHDFASSDGRLSIPVAAVNGDKAGTANVLVSTSAPGAGIVSTRVRVWKANVTLDAPSWTVNQAIDQLKINAKADGATECQITTNENRAKRASAIDDPTCYLEWDTLPPGVVPAHDAPGLRGYAATKGDQEIKYSVWIYDHDGNPYLLQQASKTLHVANPDGVISFAPDKDISEVYHVVEKLNFDFEQQDGPECRATTSFKEAKRSVGTNRLTCLIEWTRLPSGLEQISYRDQPQLRGHVEDGGVNELAWRVSVVTINDKKVVLNEQSLDIDAVPPPEPGIAMGKDNLIKAGMYVAPMKGGYLGDAKITSYNAPLDVIVSRDGQTIDSATSPSGWGDRNVVQRRIVADERPLWSQTPYKIDAGYAALSDSKANKAFSVLAVPSRNIAPTIEADGDTVLNTEPLKVSTRIVDPFADSGYDPEMMGDWKIRIVQMHGREVTPLTDYEDMPATGDKSFTLDLDEIDSKRLRLAAQAQLVSPVDGYERTVLSNRPIYMTVLRGQPIDSTIDGRRISGEAPLTAVMTLKIDDRLDKAALGEVKWQVSTDKQSWTPLDNTSRYRTRFTHRFERGTYYVRAIVANKNSGAKFKTPTVEVSAYLLPAITLTGPENAFIGDIADYTVAPDDNNEDPDTPLVYQWSTDRGEVWFDAEPSFHISRAEEARIPIWVRARYETAPADDDDAWTRERTRLSFRKIRPPRVRIVGPRLLETGKPRDFRAAVRPPYRNMDVEIKGEWTLPDGSRNSDSRELAYTANDADLANERVKLAYTTWVDGYKDKDAVGSDSLPLRIWQYEWPEFQITTRQGSDYAPSDVVTRLRSTSTTRFRDLDEPKVEWSLPEGLAVSESSRDTTRTLEAKKPGEYVLRVRITDARGHSATVSKKVVFKPAPPYEFDLRYTASNRYDRAPMDIRVRPYIRGGHPRDRIKSYSYTLDGKPVETESRFGEMTIADAGKHRVGLTIKTRMGSAAKGHMDLAAKENQSPTCSIKARSARTYWRFYARCNDPDGRMSGYEWMLNGENVDSSSYRITVRKDDEGVPTVKVVGQDDSGARSAPVIWHGDP